MKYLPLLWAGPLPQEDAHHPHAAVGRGRLPALRPARTRCTVAFESGADSADAKRLLTTARYSIIEPLPLSLPAPDRAGAGRDGRGLRRLVRRQVPEREQRLPGLRGGPARATSTCTPSSPSPPAQREAFAADADRRGGGPAPGRSLRLDASARSCRSAPRSTPRADGEPQLGVRPRRHHRRRRSGGARQHRRGADQRRLLRRGAPDRQGQDGLVHRARRRPGAGAGHRRRDRRGASRTRPTRRRPSPRRSSPSASPSRSATSARSSRASSPRCSSPSCS